jgi:hypothetical protein
MDHLFHKNLLAEKHNLEWQLAQANIKIKNLEEQLNRVKRQTVLSEEIGVPNVPPLPKPTPQPMPQPLPLPDESRPVPMPKPKPPIPAMPSLDDIKEFIRKYLSGGGGNQITENIERNIAECIFENRNLIIQNMMHNSPNLFENRQIDSEVATKILYVVMEDIMSDQDFILQNYKVLGAPTLTEDARNVIMERFGLGKLLGKIIRKVAGYFGGGKKVIPPPQTPGDPLVRIGPKGTDYERIIRPEDIR